MEWKRVVMLGKTPVCLGRCAQPEPQAQFPRRSIETTKYLYLRQVVPRGQQRIVVRNLLSVTELSSLFNVSKMFQESALTRF